MKIWKMAVSLLLLTVIICGCVVMGRSVEVSAAPNGDGTGEQTGNPEENQTPEDGEQGPTGGSVTVEKVYSQGLYFRSNGDGTCALAGVGSCTSACILIPPTSPAGDSVTEILPNAFAGSIVGAIEIPTCVTEVSGAAFASCPRLSYVRVAAGNPALLEYNGALYSADGTRLIYCPAGIGAQELQLHPALKRIAAGAFGDCTNLRSVYYAGTAAQWHGVIVGDENDALYAASMRFGG